MKTTHICGVALIASVILLGGCGGGLLIKPVNTNEPLTETVISETPGWGLKQKIVVIEVGGLIVNERPSGTPWGRQENPVSLFVEKVDKAENDPSVCAIVLRVNSPGGGVTASDIMYHRLAQAKRQRNLPIVAIIEDVGASGGYYVACAADTIMAHRTSIVGSIGVIVQTVSFSGAMKMLGVKTKAVTSGKRKTMGSPLKPIDPGDIAILQTLVDDYYGNFLAVVAASRTKLNAAEIRKLADGRVYSAEQAHKNGLVDSLGYMDDAIELAQKRSGCKSVKVVMYARPMGYRANAYSKTPAAPQFNMVQINTSALMNMQQPRFLYLWTQD